MGYLYRGIIKGLNENGATVVIPVISPVHKFDAMQVYTSTVLQVDDQVIIGTVGDIMENFVVLGRLSPAVGRESMPIYFFESEADRDIVFPSPPISSVVVWIDDIGELQVYSLTEDDWITVSWDEARIATIESNVATHETRLDNHDTDIFNLQLSALSDDARLDALESPAFNTTDSSTIDFTYNSGTRNLTGSVIANSITLDQLSGVSVSSQLAKHVLVVDGTGTNWVNRLLVLDDLGECIITSQATGNILRFDGTNWVNVSESTVFPNVQGINNVAVTSGTDTRANTAFGNLGGTGAVTSFSFTKKYTSTRLRVSMHATFFSSASTTGAKFGVNIDSTDYTICQIAPTTTSGVHLQASGTKIISGVSSGAKTVQGRWATLVATTCSRDNADWLSIDCEEVAP